MQEAEHSLTAMAMNSGRYSGDETLLVTFYTAPYLSKTKSREAERPIYEDTTYVKIMTPGNKDHIVARPATARDKQRFSVQYRKFEANQDQDVVEGTPLEEWAGITRSQIMELRHINIRTVEQLASVSDANTQGLMGVGMLKDKAAKWLASTKDDAMKQRLDEMEAKYNEAIALLNQHPETAQKKRGRPKKEEVENAPEE